MPQQRVLTKTKSHVLRKCVKVQLKDENAAEGSKRRRKEKEKRYTATITLYCFDCMIIHPSYRTNSTENFHSYHCCLNSHKLGDTYRKCHFFARRRAQSHSRHTSGRILLNAVHASDTLCTAQLLRYCFKVSYRKIGDADSIIISYACMYLVNTPNTSTSINQMTYCFVASYTRGQQSSAS